MPTVNLRLIVSFFAFFLVAAGAFAEVATVVSAKPGAALVRDGKSTQLIAGSRLSQGDVIVTNASGQVEIYFDDKTKMAVGPNSRVAMDDIVMRNNNTASSFAINAVKGTFRFISGGSPKNVYDISTPTATIGIRGTKFDFSVLNFKFSDIVVHESTVEFCSLSGQCGLFSGQTGACNLGRADQSRGFARIEDEPTAASALLNHFPFVVNQAPLQPAFRVALGACEDVVKAATRPSARAQPGSQSSGEPQLGPNGEVLPEQPGQPPVTDGGGSPSSPPTAPPAGDPTGGTGGTQNPGASGGAGNSTGKGNETAWNAGNKPSGN